MGAVPNETRISKDIARQVLSALTTALSLAQVLELPYHEMRLHTFLMRTGDFRRAYVASGVALNAPRWWHASFHPDHQPPAVASSRAASFISCS
jgi:hypothetical protein